MNQRLLNWQLLACAALSVILVAEWAIGEANHSQLQATLDKTVLADYQSDALPELDLAKQASESYNAIVERPLFIEGRKPIAEQAADSPAAADNGQLDDWLLIGVYNKGERKLALFRKQNEAKSFLKITENQSVSGWQLIQIQADRVLLQQGGQQKSIMLRKPRPQGKLPMPAKKPIPPVPPIQPAQQDLPINNIPPENENND
ncbi:MAG: hypothetical protein CTY19_02310 [Methylomonas sp.]|nr:MAG: hypothetical protein CTY19_02310 [Methylomonas sp.]